MGTRKYEALKSHWDKYRYRSIRMQKFDVAGLTECEEIYLKEPLPAQVKNEQAKGFLELLLDILNEELCPEEIKNYVNTFPVIQYYFVLVDKINILLNEGILSKDRLYKLAKEYTTNFEEKNLIKAGLTMLRFADCEEALEILKVYSNLNEFIFYSVEGMKAYRHCNTNIFNVAKASKGYGRILSISNVEPLSEDIRSWLIEEGNSGGYLDPVIVAMIFSELDYFEYFDEDEKSKNKFACLTRNLLSLCELREYLNEHISFKLVNLYWEYYKAFGGDFKSRFIMAILLTTIIDNTESNNNGNGDNILHNHEEEHFAEIAEAFMSEEHEEILLEAISNKAEKISEILELAQMLEINISFEYMKVALDEEPYNTEIYEYIMLGNSLSDKSKLIKYVDKSKIFDMIMTGEENLQEDAISDKFFPDSCLFILINKMGNLAQKHIKLNLRALKARYAPTRLEAIKNISKLKKEQIKIYSDVIMECSSNEEDIKIKKELLRLLDNNEVTNIEIKDIEELEITEHVKDISLAKIELQLINDREDYFESVQVNDLLILKRDELNINDDNAILIINYSGEYLGMVPSEKSDILYSLIKNGKIIYGKILEKNDKKRMIKISIILSYNDVVDEVTNTLNMVSAVKIGYLN